MPDLVIAARDASLADRAEADIVCDGRTDVAVLAKALGGEFDEVALTAGTFDANGGHAPDGSRRLRIAGEMTVSLSRRKKMRRLPEPLFCDGVQRCSVCGQAGPQDLFL